MERRVNSGTLVLHGRATEGDTKHKNLRALVLIAAFLAYLLRLLIILEPSNPFDFSVSLLLHPLVLSFTR